ncbi:hypothetical protein [Mariniblastus fucicola]|uniref:Type II secretion system protein GspF domain-containing protein n=1 Tax=Mariniblastus fucicola TaxID=980251 RepID=A0A5B9P4V7_9BACT|nr:hypothetical protein [Mariniblastus fucicola]QEG20519.1 hypothetical protein MFFC18_03680 [Mariniblastus fucicola]
MSTDLQLFYNDLRAAVEAGVHMEIGDKTLPDSALTTKSLDRLEQRVASGESVPARYQAAMETWEKTGSMIPVLEGLSTRAKAWKKVGRLFRNSMIYVLLIAIVAIAAMAHYLWNILPEIEAIRHDLTTLARPHEPIGTSRAALWAKLALGFFVLLFLGLLVAMRRGGIAKAGLWAGGRSFMRCQTLATASRTMQLLITNGVESENAALLSGTLAGLDREGQGELLHAIKGLSPEEVRSPALADYLLMIADHQFVTTRTWGPGVLIVVVGGAFAFLFAILAYGPIAALLHDLSNVTRL